MTLPRLEVDPDVRNARTPPREVYGDPDWYRAQVDRVLARSWTWIGHEGQVADAGSLCPSTLLPGSLEEPVILARDAAGEVRCLSNVCTHRGNVLVETAGRAAGIRCRYHGRSFGLDGRVVSAPGFEGVAGFPSEGDALPRPPLGRWRGHLFASLDPAAPFDAWAAAAKDLLGWYPLEEAVFDPSSSRTFEVDAHWALYVENYLEGFHVPYVHGGLAKALDLGLYETRPLPFGVLQIGHASGDETAFRAPAAPVKSSRPVAAYWLWLFPTTMLNLYPWGLSLNVVEPLGPARTRVRFLSWVRDASLRRKGAGGDLDRVEAEDERVVESVQRGVRSRLWRGGRLSPAHESGVHRFHRLLAAHWNRDPLPPPGPPKTSETRP